MISAQVTGDREVALRLHAAGPRAKAEIGVAMGRIVLKLMRHVVENKLTGQVLRRKTGTLARAVTQSPRVYEVGSATVGTVGIANLTGPGGRAPVLYGAAHEFGFHGKVTVQQHLRTITQAWGRPLGAPRVVTVHSHTATRNLPVRSFLRTSLRELDEQGVYRAEIAAGVARALQR